MKRFLLFLGMIVSAPVVALSPAAQEFMTISRELEPVQCENAGCGARSPRLKRSSDPEDLQAISRQQREAFYRCE